MGTTTLLRLWDFGADPAFPLSEGCPGRREAAEEERQRKRGPVGLLHEKKGHFKYHRRPYLEREDILEVQRSIQKNHICCMAQTYCYNDLHILSARGN